MTPRQMVLGLFIVCLLTSGTLANTATCHPVHFWVEEGQLLAGNLLSVDTSKNTFHNFLWTGGPLYNTAATCTSGDPIFTSSGPKHHTPTGTRYTPAVGDFTLDPAGTFKYINLPSFSSPTVWNGYDSFLFKAQCADSSWCTETAYINVVYTSASTHNSALPPWNSGYTTHDHILCTGSCAGKSDGMWMARHYLPRIWDMLPDQSGKPVKPTVSWNTQTDIPTDGLDLEWSSNYAIISTYGAIANMAVRFPTMEAVTWKPGSKFKADDVKSHVAKLSTGFDIDCLDKQEYNDADKGTQVWNPLDDYTDGSLVANYNSGSSWYQKFGGKHSECDVFTGPDTACKYAPLLTPRVTQKEDDGGVWKVSIIKCTVKWQGKFTWNALRNQTLHNNNKAWFIDNDGNGNYVITGNMYNEAVQPNSWTEPVRGFTWLDHLYLLKIHLAQDTDFQFELGIDAFTVDLQQYRYFDDGDFAFGYNMIVYPTQLNDITPQSQPDRRIVGYRWVSQTWTAPNDDQCGPSCGATKTCTSTNEVPVADYKLSEFPTVDGCSDPRILLFKGPATTLSDCDNSDEHMVILDTRGISPQDPSEDKKCTTTFQNITLRGKAPRSGSQVSIEHGFGFEGTIVLTFLLANGEHPHFQLTPKLYVKSLCVRGAFSGSTATCRGSPKWPVKEYNTGGLPDHLCEEVDARTFGPTDWAIIMFDIKDVNYDVVELRELYIKFGEGDDLKVTLDGDALYISQNSGTMWDPNFPYLNYRNLVKLDLLHTQENAPSHPSGVQPPKDMDFGFAFTPGAHNENIKIRIYCKLRIKKTPSKNARFKFAATPDGESTLQERIQIQRQFNTQRAASNAALSQQAAGASDSSNSSSKITIGVLACACAVLLAAVVGMALYIVRNGAHNTPKRVGSTAAE